MKSFCKLILNENEIKKDSHCESLVVSTSAQWFIDILFITRDSRMSNKLCGPKLMQKIALSLWALFCLLSFCLVVEFAKAETHILVVELDLAEMTCVSRNVRRTLHVPSGVLVQRSISERSVSYPNCFVNPPPQLLCSFSFRGCRWFVVGYLLSRLLAMSPRYDVSFYLFEYR